MVDDHKGASSGPSLKIDSYLIYNLVTQLKATKFSGNDELILGFKEHF